MLLTRRWAMPNKCTFTIKPIKELIKTELKTPIVDPFPYPYKEDALKYMKSIPSQSHISIVYDPPYSPRQLKECYDDLGISVGSHSNGKYWANCKNESSRILKLGGKCISFGWNSGGLGMKRGMQIKSILLVPHGGLHNDTICTVEEKIQNIKF